MRINLLLAANLNDSLNRISVEWANAIVKMGHQVTISYPRINHIDYYRWVFSWNVKNRGGNFRVVAALLRFINSLNIRSVFHQWYGFEITTPSDQITLNRFFVRATNRNMPDADYIVAMNGIYLLPNMFFLAKEKGELISSIHMNYDHAVVDPMQVVAEWNRSLVEMEKRILVRRFVESLKNQKACQSMGILVDGIVPPGINLEQFSDSKRRGDNGLPLRITLFCHPRSHKGLAEGIAVVEEVISRINKVSGCSEIIFSTLGNVGDHDVSLFDHHFGYLSKEAYPKALKQSDIFIYPELYSGFGVPPLHAMACGCAVVMNDIDGTDEYGKDRVNCMMSYPGEIDVMANHIMTLIKDSGLRDKIRNEAVSTAALFTWKKSAEKLVHFLGHIK